MTRQESTPAEFDLLGLVEERRGEEVELLERHINPRFAKVLRTIGFDKSYARGEGAYLWDKDGAKYLDFLSGYGMFNLGRNHPVIQKAIRDYLELDDPWKIQMGATLLPGILAERLLAYVPHLDKVTFTNSGTESVEAALKYARCATGREQVVFFDRAFHGLTCGSLSVNGCESFREGFGELLPGSVKVALGDLDALARAMQQRPTAAVIIEPVQGKGVFPASAEFLLGAQALCRKHGAKLIVDEVQSGFGRTGRMFAFQHVAGLEPDIVTSAKALSGGYVPVGAVLYGDDTYNRVFSRLDRCVVHSSTFGQGGLAMACGLATLHVLETEPLLENAESKGRALVEGIRALIPRYELLSEVRGSGLMIGIEFAEPRSMTLRTGWAMLHKADAGLFPQTVTIPLLRDHRILTQVAGHHMDVIKLLPTLVIDDEDVRWFLDAFEQVVARCHKFPGPLWTTAKDLLGVALSSR